MTQELSEDQKRKIEEENYRQEVRTQQEQKDQQHSSFPWPIVFILVIIALLIVVDSPIFLGKKKDTKNNQSTIQTDVNEESRKLLELEKEKVEKAKEEKQQKITELGDTFCKERSEPYARYVNLDDFLLMTEKSGEKVNLRPVGNKPPVRAKCDKVMEWCLSYWTEEDCTKIAGRKIWMGMTTNQLELSWGLPNDRNETVTKWGIHTQWVYGSFGPYVYLEGKNDNDLKVTSWQD